MPLEAAELPLSDSSAMIIKSVIISPASGAVGVAGPGAAAEGEITTRAGAAPELAEIAGVAVAADLALGAGVATFTSG